MFSFYQYLEEGIHDPSTFKVIFLAGGPGSGKSYVQGQTVPKSLGLKTVNSDDAFEALMKKQGKEMDPKTIASPEGQATRDRAKEITKKRFNFWVDGRLGLIIDGTGKDYNKIKKQKIALEAKGYDCYMIFVNTSEEVALTRNAERDRSLPDDMVRKLWLEVQKNIGAFQNLFGGNNFIIVDNNSAGEEVFLMVFKQIKKFLNKPVKNYIALQWIEYTKSIIKLRGKS